MLWNIQDRRTRPHRWRRVDAIVEGAMHDNGAPDADQAPTYRTFVYEDREDISLEEAIVWAMSFHCPVTLSINDVERLPIVNEDDAAPRDVA